MSSCMPDQARDDLGLPVPSPGRVRRVVSLVPSLTESIAATAPGLLVGATDWCTHPADLDVTRVSGTKNPDLDAIVALRPDLVLANEEENRPGDLDALRASGVPVWVTAPADRAGGARLARADADAGVPSRRTRVAARGAGGVGVPGAGPGAYGAHPDLAPAVDGAGAATRSPATCCCGSASTTCSRTTPSATRRRWRARRRSSRIDLVVLPDEPYAFSPDDGPEAFAPTPAGRRRACVSGRHLTWYGPSLVEARDRAQAAARYVKG